MIGALVVLLICPIYVCFREKRFRVLDIVGQTLFY